MHKAQHMGYRVLKDSDQPGLWLWRAPSGEGSCLSFESEAAAWRDADEHAMLNAEAA